LDLIIIINVLTVQLWIKDFYSMEIVLLVHPHLFMMDKLVSAKLEVNK